MKLQNDLYIVTFVSNFTDICIPSLLFIFCRILWKVFQWSNTAQKLNKGVAQPSKYLSPIWWILVPPAVPLVRSTKFFSVHLGVIACCFPQATQSH